MSAIEKSISNLDNALSQLETALLRGDKVFNMSGGEQLRDYLPIGTVADYIIKISLKTLNIEFYDNFKNI